MRGLHDGLRPIRVACRSPVIAVAFAAVVTALGALLRLSLADNSPRFITFYPAVAFAALVGGPLSGFAATIFSTAFAAILYFGTHHPYSGAVSDTVSIANFFLTGVVISLIAAADRAGAARDLKQSARAADETEARHHATITALHEGVLVFSADGKLHSWNPSAERILGQDAERMRRHDGFVDWGILHEDGTPMRLVDYPAVRALYSGQASHGEVIGVPVGDQIVWLLNNAEPVRDPLTGEISSVVISFSDVTERRRIARDLKESRARFASIVETAMDGIISVDETQRIVLFNKAAERIFRCSEAEALGLPLYTFVPERYRAKHMAAFKSFAAEGVASRPADGRGFVLTVCRLDGSEFPIEASISRVDIDGRPLFTIIHRNISRRLETERVNARLATVVKSISAAIVTAGPDRRIDTWNPGAEALFGYTAEQAIGRYAEFLSPPGEDDNVRSFFDRVQQGEHVRREARRLRADGTIVDVAVSAAPIIGTHGRVTAVAAIITDITERKRQERLLEERDVELRHTLDAAGLGVWWVDLKDGMLHADPRSQALFRMEEVAPTTVISERFHPEDQAHFSGLRDQLDSSTSHRGLTLRLRDPEGSLVWLGMTARLRATDQGREEIWGTVRDVTEQRTAEQALRQIEASRRLEALGRMTGGIAHDFNNLLTVISGNLQLLEMVTKDPTANRWIAEALRATETGSNLNHRLSTFARQRRLDPVITDLNDRISAMIDLIHRSVGPTISVTAIFSEDPWPVRIDPSEIENAVLNLAFNARDAMPEGGRIVIETSNVIIDEQQLTPGAERNRGPHVRLSVTDTGCGMTPEVKARAFEPFFTTKEIGRGTGLGLATLHGFVKQSCGFVTLYSEVGHGTTVAIYLPRDGDGPETVRVACNSALPHGNGEAILVVEDNPDVAKVTRERLVAFGWRVESAGNADEALARIATGEHFDLVFSDIMMPGSLTGLELARRLKASDPSRRVLLTSGFSQEIARGDPALPLEFEVLRKPYSLADLIGAVSAALRAPEGPRDTSAVKT